MKMSHPRPQLQLHASLQRSPATATATFYQYQPGQHKRRRRTSEKEKRRFEDVYQDDPNPSVTKRKAIAEELRVPQRKVQIWFQNRRAKDKKEKRKLAQAQVQATEGARAASTPASSPELEPDEDAFEMSDTQSSSPVPATDTDTDTDMHDGSSRSSSSPGASSAAPTPSPPPPPSSSSSSPSSSSLSSPISPPSESDTITIPSPAPAPPRVLPDTIPPRPFARNPAQPDASIPSHAHDPYIAPDLRHHHLTQRRQSLPLFYGSARGGGGEYYATPYPAHDAPYAFTPDPYAYPPRGFDPSRRRSTADPHTHWHALRLLANPYAHYVATRNSQIYGYGSGGDGRAAGRAGRAGAGGVGGEGSGGGEGSQHARRCSLDASGMYVLSTREVGPPPPGPLPAPDFSFPRRPKEEREDEEELERGVRPDEYAGGPHARFGSVASVGESESSVSSSAFFSESSAGSRRGSVCEDGRRDSVASTHMLESFSGLTVNPNCSISHPSSTPPSRRPSYIDLPMPSVESQSYSSASTIGGSPPQAQESSPPPCSGTSVSTSTPPVRRNSSSLAHALQPLEKSVPSAEPERYTITDMSPVLFAQDYSFPDAAPKTHHSYGPYDIPPDADVPAASSSELAYATHDEHQHAYGLSSPQSQPQAPTYPEQTYSAQSYQSQSPDLSDVYGYQIGTAGRPAPEMGDLLEGRLAEENQPYTGGIELHGQCVPATLTYEAYEFAHASFEMYP